MMAHPNVEELITKLEKGRQKTLATFSTLTAGQWQQTVYTEPHWQVRALLAHLVSAENQLLRLAQDTASGGQGAPSGFDIDKYNADEQKRLEGQSEQALLGELEEARHRTMEWVGVLGPDELGKIGYHPALG